MGRLKLIALLFVSTVAFSTVASDIVAAQCGTVIGTTYDRPANFATCAGITGPSAVMTQFEADIDAEPGWANHVITWPSRTGFPTQNTITVNAGSTSVGVQLNAIGYRAAMRAAGENRIRVQNTYLPSPRNPAPITSIRNREFIYAYPPVSAGSGHYRIATPLAFTVALSPTLYDDRDVTITPRYKGVQQKQDGTFICVVEAAQPADLPNNLDDYGSCPELGRSMTFRLLIRSQWTTSSETRLMVREPAQASATARTGWMNASAANVTTNIPTGSDVYWQYRLRLNGASKDQDFSITSQTQRSVTAGSAPGLDTSLLAPTSGSPVAVNSMTTTVANTTFPDIIRSPVFTMTSAMTGSTICERVNWAPASSTAGAAPTGTGASSLNNCVRLAYNPNLTPVTSSTFQSITPGTTSIPISSEITSSGTSNEFETRAGVARFVLKGSAALDRTGSGTATGITTAAEYPCRVATGVVATAASECRTMLERTFAPNSLPAAGVESLLSDASQDISDIAGLTVGDEVCFITVVNRYASGQLETSWRHSPAICIIVGKSPNTQVWGNDLRVGSGFTAADAKFSQVSSWLRSTSSGTYGSWSEYGVFAPNAVTGVGSSAGFVGGSTSVASDWSRLTFANTTAPYGNFVPNTQLDQLGLLPNVFAYKNLFRDAYVRDSNSALVNWPNVPPTTPGDPVYIIHDARGVGTVRINGNLIRPGTYDNVREMPILVILANNIVIHSNVSRIDAWIIANGKIDTCWQVTPPMTAVGNCSGRLTINGPVIARELDLKRTYGGDSSATAETPAEVFNMPASDYIWAHDQAQRAGTLKTVYVDQLPPRY